MYQSLGVLFFIEGCPLGYFIYTPFNYLVLKYSENAEMLLSWEEAASKPLQTTQTCLCGSKFIFQKNLLYDASSVYNDWRPIYVLNLSPKGLCKMVEALFDGFNDCISVFSKSDNTDKIFSRTLSVEEMRCHIIIIIL